jgi:hypothetical protein
VFFQVCLSVWKNSMSNAFLIFEDWKNIAEEIGIIINQLIG